MPRVFRYAWILKTKFQLRSHATLFDAAPRPHNVELLWTYKVRQRTSLDTRRCLFELHAGREGARLPTDLPLEVSRPSNDDDVWFTTSEQLIDALGPVGQDYARPKKYDWLVDLSFADPLLVALDRKRAIEKVKEAQGKQQLMQEQGKHGKSRKGILIEYLRHIHPIIQYQSQIEDPAVVNTKLDWGLLKVFDNNTCWWLRDRGLDVTDVMDWTWVLTANTSERAVMRLMLLAAGTFESRKESSGSRLLEEIHLDQSNEHSAREANGIIKDGKNGMTEHVFIILIIRLLRRARLVWPAACENIVALLNRYLNGINFRKGASPLTTLEPDDVDQITYVYNTILRLLSLPSSVHPFQSAVFQQRAQFSVLRRMNQFSPPLTVDKRGYQAIVKMQLMHKKTLKEREWAHMKAKSWPPWKEEKLGMDATIGVEHGISRAKEVLRGAEEAGYTTDGWDDVAGILSGWDTDGSPTIQTRSISKYPLSEPKQTKETRQGNVWAARIQATRTLDEAWSCFLSWKDQTKIADTGQQVYLAMFMKVVYNSARTSRKSKKTGYNALSVAEPLPGDGLEVMAAPESPREAVYVRRPSPDMDELFEMMKQDKIKASGRLLTFLISKASTFKAGVKYLESSILQPQHLAALLGDNLANSPESKNALDAIPTHLFTGFIEFLARFAPTMSDKNGVDHYTYVQTGLSTATDRWSRTVDAGNLTYPDAEPQFNPLLKAYELLLARRPKYRPAWYHLFHALVRPKAVTGVYSRFANQDSQDIKTWRMLCTLLNQMLEIDLHIDLDGFSIICIGLEKAIFASERQLRSKARYQTQADGHQENDKARNSTYWEHYVLSRGLPLAKEIFKDAARSSGMQQSIPDTVATEKSEIDRLAQIEQDTTATDGASHEAEDAQSHPKNAFLPPACLLPKLLEVPHPAHLHAFIRVLGLRRDYDGILDLVEWMSLFADEIDLVVQESMNGRRMMRRCVTAIRVFLERSWMRIQRDDGDEQAGHDGIVAEAEGAPEEVVRAVRDIVVENKRWGGWAGEEEVVEYCSRGKFL